MNTPSKEQVVAKSRTKKEGTFPEVALSPQHYTYARKMRGRSGYSFYDILVTKPLQRKDLAAFSQRLFLLDAALELAPAWPALGWLPLETDRSFIRYAWVAYPPALTLTPAASQRGIRELETDYYLVTSWFNPADNMAHSKQTPASAAQLQGLCRWGLTTQARIEEKLRLHYGLTPDGQEIELIPLPHQSLDNT
jgi:hypothetical protein